MATKAEEFIQACEDAVAAHDAGRWSNSRDSISRSKWYVAFLEYQSEALSCSVFNESKELFHLRYVFSAAMDADICLVPGDSAWIKALRDAIAAVKGQ
jgi:hypothetical protein